MNTVTLSEKTYQLLQRKAEESTQTPDQVADQLLRQQLVPKHAYIEIITKFTGTQAVIKNTRIPVNIIIGYLQAGETPESLVERIMPHLTFAQVYDALSYYYDHREEIDQEMDENTETAGKAYLREQLGEEEYLRITGQIK
jgi:uncharacterized protein (DUF433 family)